MSQLIEIAEAAVSFIAAYINKLNENWLTQCFIILVVLDIVVNAILIVRGSK